MPAGSRAAAAPPPRRGSDAAPARAAAAGRARARILRPVLGTARLRAARAPGRGPIRSIAVIAARAPRPGAARGGAAPRPARGLLERDPPLGWPATATSPTPSTATSTSPGPSTRCAPARRSAAARRRLAARRCAVLDTGVDVGHPDLAGRIGRGLRHRLGRRGRDRPVGHGTFVAGLISAVTATASAARAWPATTDGPAGARVHHRRRSRSATSCAASTSRSAAGADVVNLSLAGATFSASQARALASAFFNDVLPVAASGNRALDGNPLEFPAAFLGGARRAPGIGLSVARHAAGRPAADVLEPQRLREPRRAGRDRPTAGAACSPTVPRNRERDLGRPDRAAATRRVSSGGRRPLGLRRRARASPPRSPPASRRSPGRSSRELQSEQVAHVLAAARPARRSAPARWNEFTAAGVVDGGAARRRSATRPTTSTRPACAPRARRRRPAQSRCACGAPGDRDHAGHELAGGRQLLGARCSHRRRPSSAAAAARRPRPFQHATCALRPACAHAAGRARATRNANCGVQAAGPLRARG